MFKTPFSFTGRIRRMEFGLSFLIYFVIGGISQFIPGIRSDETDFSSILFLFIFLPLLWFMLAQGAKRCHDRGNTGWFQIIPFYSLWMLFADSEPGQNQFGPNPKGIGNFDEIDQIGSHLES